MADAGSLMEADLADGRSRRAAVGASLTVVPADAHSRMAADSSSVIDLAAARSRIAAVGATSAVAPPADAY